VDPYAVAWRAPYCPVPWPNFCQVLAVDRLTLEYFGIQRSSWWLQGVQVLWLQNKPTSAVGMRDLCWYDVSGFFPNVALSIMAKHNYWGSFVLRNVQKSKWFNVRNLWGHSQRLVAVNVAKDGLTKYWFAKQQNRKNTWQKNTVMTLGHSNMVVSLMNILIFQLALRINTSTSPLMCIIFCSVFFLSFPFLFVLAFPVLLCLWLLGHLPFFLSPMGWSGQLWLTWPSGCPKHSNAKRKDIMIKEKNDYLNILFI